MIVLNVIDGVISASVDSEILTRTYSEETFKQLSDLADKANNAQTVKDYQDAVKAFKESCVEEIGGYLGTFHNDIFIDNKTQKYYLKCNGKISAVPMPETMVNRIKESLDKKIDINPLLKAWIRFLRNPKVRDSSQDIVSKFSSRFFNYVDIKYTNSELVEKLMSEKGYSQEVATKLATTYQVKITNEGLIATYKVSTEITKRFKLDSLGNTVEYDINTTEPESIDEITGLVTYKKKELINEDRAFQPCMMGTGGDSFMCSVTGKLGHVIKVGGRHSITWDQINTDDDASCVKGLHCGNLSYIRGYQSHGTETHNTLVCPSKIGAIPDDTTGALRCVEYFTLDCFSGVNGSIYHSSKYGEKLDSEWAVEKEQIIKDYGVLLQKDTDQIQKNIDSLV